MNFCSDNVTAVAPEIMAALATANDGMAMPYGDDPLSQSLDKKFSELFETVVTIFPVATGSAANALALSAITPPFGAVYCHTQSHINVDECGAPEFYTGGAKLVTVPGNQAKIQATHLASVLEKSGAGTVHHVQPAAVSLSQATEAGTVYSIHETAEVCRVARTHNLIVHMDGARFANAVVNLGCTPAEATWRAGIDVLSFGATKNGAMAAEAVVFFNPALAKTFHYHRKRGGHLWSKMRFLSAQLDAYITDNLWLQHAAHANRMAIKLAEGLASLPGATLRYPVEANELFVALHPEIAENLLADDFQFYRWNHDTIRLVTAFNTKEEEVIAFVQAAQRHACPALTS